jgi:beta-lactam-binding protein with PASTA domain
VIVARKTDTTPLPTSAAASPDSVVSLVADGPIGTMPDLTGMSARDAMRKLVRLGVTPRMTGEGVVIAQRPEPGAALDDVEVCDLQLDRSPGRRPPAGAHQ